MPLSLKEKLPLIFLQIPDIEGTMVRKGYDADQYYEENYLTTHISHQTKKIIGQLVDTDFGNLPHTSSTFDCSTNTLGHLFYLAKILEHASCNGRSPTTIKTVLEIGGGYGNLARLIKQALPNATIIIIDLPEISALQWFFLKSTTPKNTNVIFHTKSPSDIVPQAINIIPLHLMDAIPLKTDLFVSTFALSECSQELQEYVIQKKFFNASMCYITGQVDGWGHKHNFVNQSIILTAIEQLYTNVICDQFHIVFPNLKSYELIADKMKA